MNSILKGINAISTPAVSFALGVVTGFLGSVLSPLAKENASAALDLRKKIDEVLFALDEFVNSTPQDLRCTVFSGIRRLPLIKRGKDTLRGTQGRAPGRPRTPPKRGVSKTRVGEILGRMEVSSILDDLLSQGLIYCDPSRELNFWRPTPSALLALGLRSHTDVPALKELEEWFDSQKEMRGIAKLDPFFERTSKLASRRLKRELERRGTLGEFALEPDSPHLKRILPEESGSDLCRRF
jgi:hypothetical protein